MFIAHFPAGYILTQKITQKTLKKDYFFIGLMGSILPDFDLIYFYTIDNQQHLHHGYWTHVPMFWLVIGVLVLTSLKIIKKQKYNIIAYIFFANIFIHLLLDTVVGKIQWFSPFWDKHIYFFEVPAIQSHWILNFVLHWTFLFEIMIIGYAAFLFLQKKKDTNR